MIPWVLLEKSTTPENDNELKLYQRDAEFSIKAGHYELMNSRVHNSEDELGRLACLKIKGLPKQQVLIGGLGMGFTLRVALRNLKGNARVTVAELLPVVVKWNRSFLAHLAKAPLEDKRVTVYEGDVADQINEVRDFYHAIIMDVDNGPQGLTQKTNDSLYTHRGLKAAYNALQPKGVFAVWSAGPDLSFIRRLQKTGFTVEEIKVRMKSGPKGGGQAIVWLCTKQVHV